MKQFFFLACFLLMLFPVCAFTQNVSLELNESGLAEVTHEISLEGEESIQLKVFFPEAESISFFPADKGLEYELNGGVLLVKGTGNLENFTVSYITASVTSKQGSIWMVSLDAPEGIEFFYVFLPENATVKKFFPIASIYFEPPFMVVRWAESSLSGKIGLEYEIGLNESPENNSVFLSAVAFIALMVLVYFSLKALRKFTGKKCVFSAAQADLVKALNEKEKKAVEIVFLADGITQKKCLQKCGFSKATLSRTLRSLEEKQFIFLIQDGYTKRVYLSDWFKGK